MSTPVTVLTAGWARGAGLENPTGFLTSEEAGVVLDLLQEISSFLRLPLLLPSSTWRYLGAVVCGITCSWLFTSLWPSYSCRGMEIELWARRGAMLPSWLPAGLPAISSRGMTHCNCTSLRSAEICQHFCSVICVFSELQEFKCVLLGSSFYLF